MKNVLLLLALCSFTSVAAQTKPTPAPAPTMSAPNATRLNEGEYVRAKQALAKRMRELFLLNQQAVKAMK
jgi:hypothetical protein